MDHFYCCTPTNITCDEHETYVSCPNGQIQSQEIFCEDQSACPITEYGVVSLITNCSHMQNHHCPASYLASKICADKVDVSLNDYCKGIDPTSPPGKICPLANKGLDYAQCYNP